jgi:acetylornithine deacetylase
MSGMQLTSREILARLVAFDTTSRESNLPLIDWVAQYLASHGIDSHTTTSEDGGKANLFTTIGPDDVGGVCLHAHTDVVPTDGQIWTTTPFELTERNGMLLGRGTCDMKGFAACMLAAVPMLKERRLKTPVHLALSYDEEVGCLGAPRMLAAFGRSVPRPLIAVVGEPTMMKPVIAHKGCVALETHIEGRTSHSSLPHLGASALHAAAIMACVLAELSTELQTMRYPHGMVPPGPTLNAGTLSAGTARNIVAKEAVLQWELRYRDIDNADELLAHAHFRVRERLRAVLGLKVSEFKIDTQELARVPAFCATDESQAVSLLRACRIVGVAGAVPYGAEAGQYRDAGVDTVICGPGSIEQAHRADEFIAIEQMDACNRFMGRLTQWAQQHQLQAGAPNVA